MNQKTSRLFRKWCRVHHPGDKAFYRQMKKRWVGIPGRDRKVLKDGLTMDLEK